MESLNSWYDFKARESYAEMMKTRSTFTGPKIWANRRECIMDVEGGVKFVENLSMMNAEKRARYILSELSDLYALACSGKSVDAFLSKFEFLRGKMQDFKWSKEYVEKTFGVSYKEMRKVYFSNIA